MAGIPPWLAPQDFIGAMARGAQLGLSVRAQDQADEQHAAALALKRDELDVRQAQNAAAFKQAAARAAEALRKDNALETWRQQTLAEQQKLHATQAANAAAAREEAKSRNAAMLDIAQRGLSLREDAANAKLSPTERASLGGLRHELQLRQSEMVKADTFAPTQIELDDLMEKNKGMTKIDALNKYRQDRIAALNQNIQSLSKKIQSFGQGNATGTNAPAAGDALQGGGMNPTKFMIQRKSDGKKFLYSGNAEDVPTDKYEVLK